MKTDEISIQLMIDYFLDSVALSRSENTARTYRNGMKKFMLMLETHDYDPADDAISTISEDAIIWFISDLKTLSATSERLYLTAAQQFFEYLAAEKIIPVNLPRIKLLIKQRARRPGQRLPQFPKNAIEEVLKYCEELPKFPTETKNEHLRNMRDRAFLITLADTGLRVHEACNLRRGDIDWNEGRMIVIGKGNYEAVVRISQRAQKAIKEYLKCRAEIDGSSGKALSALPIFARHDKGAGKKIKPISTATGRNIVSQRVKESLGVGAVGSITPHSFRHYFVTTVLKASGNLKMAQELARHKNIQVTTRYAHLSDDELDKGYWEIFEQRDQLKKD